MDTIRKTIRHQEYQYLELIENIISNGDEVTGRNGKVLSIFGNQMRFSLSKLITENESEKTVNIVPFLSTKKLAWKTCAKELFWFIRGETDNKILKKQNIHIWDKNSTREFLDSRGLLNNYEDDLGPVYGWQWRRFNKPYNLNREVAVSMEKNYNIKNTNKINNGVDQLQYVIDALKNNDTENNRTENKYSRRLIVSAWNPQQINDMALPPCHVMFQFNVNSKNELSCSLYQRSGDVGLGVPFNIASYSLLTHIIAKHCGLKPGELIYTLGNAHIYEEHIEVLKEQIKREPFDFPTIDITNKYDVINVYSLSDIEINNYVYHSSIKMDMKE